MRIAILTRTLDHVGGIETYVTLSSAGLRARRHVVEVLASDDGAHGGVVEAVERAAPDVVLSHGLGDPADEAAVVGRWPTAFFAHVYHGTCVGGAKTWSFPSPVPCSRVLGVGCLALYYPRRCGGWSPLTMVRQFDVQRRRLDAIRGCRAVLCLSQHIAAEYERHGVPVNRLHVLPPLVRNVADPADPPTGPPHIVYAGRLEPLKGPQVLLEALGHVCDRLGPLRVTVAGAGSAAGALASQAAALTERRPSLQVRLVGKLPPEAMDGLLRSASLLAVPSLWPEPFGLIGLEAAARGVPAVAFATGGIPEWLEDGVNGRLAAVHGSARSLADAIVDVLEDGGNYLALRAGARATACRVTADDHLTRLELLLDRVARRRDDT